METKIAVSESVSLRPPPYTHCRYVANMLKYIVHKEDTTSMFKSLECAPAQPSALGRPPLATRHSPLAKMTCCMCAQPRRGRRAAGAGDLAHGW